MVKTSLNVLKIMFKYAKLQAAIFCIGMFSQALIPPLVLIVTQEMINSTTVGIQQKQLSYMIIIWTLLVLLLEILQKTLKYANRINALALKKRIYNEFSENILKKYKEVQFSCFEEEEACNIIKHVGNAPQEAFLSFFNTLISLCTDVVSGMAYISVFFSISPFFGLLGIGALSLLLYFNYKRVIAMADLYDEQTTDERKMSYFNSVLSNKKSLLDLKLNNAREFIQQKRNDLLDKIWKERLKKTIKSQVIYSLGTMSMVMWLILVIIYIIIRVVQRSLSYGIIVALLSATQSVYFCFDQISNNLAALSRSCVKIQYFEKFLSLPENSEEGQVAIEEREIEIAFEKVSFKYPYTDKYILKDVSFCIKKNEKVVLVGTNGSGKTTIIKLLCGLYKPTSGKITINGINIEKIDKKSKENLYSVVFQDYAIYQFTIRDNVTIANALYAKQDEKVISAMICALVEDLIEDLDKNVGNIEKESINISGGQWQKLALARACFKEGCILILDEPTAAMDPSAENELYKEFLHLMNKNTSIFVSHRLAITQNCDKIIVINDGKIVQQGTHDELISQIGIYKDMYLSQSQWYV